MSSYSQFSGAKSEKAAWLAVADALRRSDEQSEPDALLLAEWLEGRLDEAEAAPIEKWIARDPKAAHARIVDLRASLAEEAPTVPARLLLRLRAIAPRRASFGSSNVVRLWRRLPEVAALAAAIALGTFGAYGGYEMGMKAALAHEQSQSASLQVDPADDFILPQEDFFFD